MTLAAAFVRSDPESDEQAVILLADSRLTFQGMGWAKDDAAKIFYLAPGVAVAIAGAYEQAVKSLSLACDHLRRGPISHVGALSSVTRAFQHFSRRDQPIQALVAVVGPGGAAKLWRIDSREGFAPTETVHGAIGWPPLISRHDQERHREASPAFSSFPSVIEALASRELMAFDRTIQGAMLLHGSSSLIGGPVQNLILTSRGASWLGASVSTDDMVTWRTLGPDDGPLTSVHRNWVFRAADGSPFLAASPLRHSFRISET